MGNGFWGIKAMVENSGFEEVNAYVYHSARGAFFGGVIWCLGPVVDDSRDYSRVRLWLASVTFRVCRCFIRAEG
jgi:hypothetical protein